MKFKETLKFELSCRNMLVKELAAISGVNKRTLDSYLAANGAEPSAEAALKIAGALNVPLQYLLTGEAKKNARKEESLIFFRKEERQLLQNYSKLNSSNKNIIQEITKLLGGLQ